DRDLRGLLRGDRSRGAGGSARVRGIYPARVKYQCDCADAEPTTNSHAHGQNALGALDGVGDLTQSGVSGESVLWQDGTAAAAANHATDPSTKRSVESGQRQS